MKPVSSIRTTVNTEGKGSKTNPAPTFFQPFIQPKLTINAPGDMYEQEADAIAETIMGMQDQPGGNSFFQPAISQVQRKCADCEEEEKKEVQRKARTVGAATVDRALHNYIGGLPGSGSSLPAHVGQFYQQRFDYDFSNVRVHTDTAAIRSAQSINSLAYTTGNNIVFNQNQFAPATATGKRLLAHELTHVVQQNKGPTTAAVQKADFGILGRKCCNHSAGTEWSLIAGGEWHQLAPDECSPTWEDCDGVTCGGGFYHTSGWAGTALMSSDCNTPRQDSPYFAPRRWTPAAAAEEAMSPTQRGSTQGDTPPGYVYDP